MFFVLSKIIGALLKPLLWVVLLLLLGLWKKKYMRKSLWISLVLVFVFGNKFLANKVMSAYEYPLQELNFAKKYDYVVVLGGFSRNRLDNGRLELNEAGDRLLAGLDLLRIGQVKKVIISGGDGSLYRTGIDEASEVKQYLEQVGYDTDKIIIEPKSKNTYENAVNTAKILSDSSKVILITSAFHMPRAAKCFSKHNIDFTPYPVDYLMDGSSPYSPSGILIPSGTAFKKWEILLKEWVGLIAYKVSGKI